MKFNVTPELAVLIKTIRTQNRISSKDLAEHINKSYSYVSKLESGDVKSILKEDLTNILTFITGGGDFFSDVLPSVVRSFHSFLDPLCLVDQLWLIQYDVIERPMCIPEEMVDDMARMMDEHTITIKMLTDMINGNVDAELNESFPENVYFAMNSHGSTRLLIRAQVKSHEIERIFSKRNLNSFYYVIQYMVYGVLRLVHFPEYQTKLPAEKAAAVLKASSAYMERFQIDTLINLSHLFASDIYIGSLIQPNVVSSLNATDEFTLNAMVELFRESIQHDPVGAIQALETFQHNLTWDMGFMYKLISIPFFNQGNLSYMHKKRLIAEIIELIERYDKMSDFEKRMEIY